MENFQLKKSIPFIVGILIFVLITMIYFNPLIQGKKLQQADITQFKGMSKEIVDYRDKTGDEALWTNSMFGGMPAYQISVKYKTNFVRFFDDIFKLRLPHPASLVFLYFLGFFILLLVLKVDPWLSIVGAIAFAFSSYFFIILEAGHNSKAHAIGYMAPVLAGIILTFREKYILGGTLTALFLALELEAGHPQITYYLLLIVIILGIFELINTIIEKTFPGFFKAMGVLLIAAILAVLTVSTSLWATYEYGKTTIRGKSELTSDKENRTSGIDKKYATDWSYGIAESFSLMIPNTKGGASGVLGNNEKAMQKVDRQFKKPVAQQNHYWGDQPGTSGPVYVGAIIIFLFILGLFIVKGRLKWILLTATILSLFLSWGKNFMPFTEFFLDYVPGYNKFRAVSMTLVIAELCIPLLAILSVNKILKDPEIIKRLKNKFFIALGLTGGLSLIFYLLPNTFFGFLSQVEIDHFNLYRQNGADAQQLDLFMANLESARISIFKSDTIRSFFFIILSAALIWLFSIKKISKNIFILILGVLFLADLVPISHRYLNNDNFVRKSKVNNPFQASIADQEIIKDQDIDYRVLNLAVNTFNDASTSYFHKSIGGYHGAKLRRYQELIKKYISQEQQQLVDILSSNTNYNVLNKSLSKMSVLNMLNTKYIIVDPAQPPIRNMFAYGNAWFVDNYISAENADEEIDFLGKYNLKQSAIVDKRFEQQLTGYKFGIDSTASIKLKHYKPNELRYKFNSGKDQLVVFSEIYYKMGWNAYVDGNLTPHFRANYVLRGMIIPAGEHNIIFKFEPKVYSIGENISLVSSILLILLLIGGLYYEIRKALKPENKS
ncbi:MAG: YfhO family protein [Bacteroidales bacterium]|nr:YfhO family protein [Bacteroidales bacterium]